MSKHVFIECERDNYYKEKTNFAEKTDFLIGFFKSKQNMGGQLLCNNTSRYRNR
jgi:hypothetical protein